MRTFEADEWDRVLDALAAQAGHAAALLDGELLPEVADDLRQAGVDLLPGAGELQPRCTCPDWADPCKHSAAACYLLADELDRDPFAVFLLRGRSREELLAGLRARRKTRVGVETPRLPTKEPSDVTTPAARAWERTPEPLPSLPLVPRRPGQPTVLAVDPPAGSPISAAGLRMIAADAAARARDLVAGERTVPFDERVEHDLARHAAGLLAGRANGQLTELGRRAGVAGRELLTLALAWQYGGTGAVSTLIEPWDPPSEQLQRGRLALGPGAVARRNRVTRRDRQLRLGRDGRWYPYAKAGGRWSPDGPPREIGPQGAAE